MVKAGLCPQTGCGMRILVVDKTGLIRRHSPKGVSSGPRAAWCPAGGTVHPDWKDLLERESGD